MELASAFNPAAQGLRQIRPSLKAEVNDLDALTSAEEMSRLAGQTIHVLTRSEALKIQEGLAEYSSPEAVIAAIRSVRPDLPALFQGLPQDYAGKHLKHLLQEALDSPALYVPFKDMDLNFIVYDDNISAAELMAGIMGIKTGDLPAPPPCTDRECRAFAIVHELEHTVSFPEVPFYRDMIKEEPPPLSPKMPGQRQMDEVDADFGSLAALNGCLRPEFADYLLAARRIGTFNGFLKKYPVPDDFDHHTSTALQMLGSEEGRRAFLSGKLSDDSMAQLSLASKVWAYLGGGPDKGIPGKRPLPGETADIVRHMLLEPVKYELSPAEQEAGARFVEAVRFIGFNIKPYNPGISTAPDPVLSAPPQP